MFCPWDFPGKNTAVGCHALLQGILLIQGSKLHLLRLRQILYPLRHLGSLGEREGRLKQRTELAWFPECCMEGHLPNMDIRLLHESKINFIFYDATAVWEIVYYSS